MELISQADGVMEASCESGRRKQNRQKGAHDSVSALSPCQSAAQTDRALSAVSKGVCPLRAGNAMSGFALSDLPAPIREVNPNP